MDPIRYTHIKLVLFQSKRVFILCHFWDVGIRFLLENSPMYFHLACLMTLTLCEQRHKCSQLHHLFYVILQSLEKVVET